MGRSMETLVRKGRNRKASQALDSPEEPIKTSNCFRPGVSDGIEQDKVTWEATRQTTELLARPV